MKLIIVNDTCIFKINATWSKWQCAIELTNILLDK